MLAHLMRILILFFLCVFSIFSHGSEVDYVIFDYGKIMRRKGMPKWVRKTLKVTRNELIRSIELKRKVNDMGISFESIHPSLGHAVSQYVPGDWKEKVKEKIINTTAPFPDMFDLIKQLEFQGIQSLALINLRTRKDKGIQKLGRFIFFEPHLYAYAMIAEKSEPAAYLMLLKEFQLDLEQCLFIDVNLENVEAAKKLGMDAIYFQEKEDLKEELEQRDIFIFEGY